MERSVLDDCGEQIEVTVVDLDLVLRGDDPVGGRPSSFAGSGASGCFGPASSGFCGFSGVDAEAAMFTTANASGSSPTGPTEKLYMPSLRSEGIVKDNFASLRSSVTTSDATSVRVKGAKSVVSAASRRVPGLKPLVVAVSSAPAAILSPGVVTTRAGSFCSGSWGSSGLSEGVGTGASGGGEGFS